MNSSSLKKFQHGRQELRIWGICNGENYRSTGTHLSRLNSRPQDSADQLSGPSSFPFEMRTTAGTSVVPLTMASCGQDARSSPGSHIESRFALPLQCNAAGGWQAAVSEFHQYPAPKTSFSTLKSGTSSLCQFFGNVRACFR
jgi:hypothetical protein